MPSTGAGRGTARPSRALRWVAPAWWVACTVAIATNGHPVWAMAFLVAPGLVFVALLATGISTGQGATS